MKLFRAETDKNTVLTTNGLYDLSEVVVNDKITEEMNGVFMLEATFALSKNVFNEQMYDLITEEAIIKCDDEYGEEIFRIGKVRKDKRSITIMAYQITISDTLTLFLKDVRPMETNGQGALTHMLDGAVGRKKEIELYSDISKQSTAYYMNKNLHEALFKEDNSFVNRWGGETKRNKYTCRIDERIGNDNGVVITSKKNLVGFEINSNTEDLATRLIPRGFDGIEAAAVDSPLINNYVSIYTKVIEFQDVRVKDENNEEGFETLALAQQELTRRAKLQYDLFNVDKIQATYTINFVELSRTEEYKNFALMERVNIGDTVTVKEDSYNTTLKARVVKRVYSPKLKRRLETKITNEKQGYTVISIESIIKELEAMKGTNANASLSDYINSMIEAGMKDSYVVLKPNELLIMDNKDINKAVNVTRYNKNGLGFSTTGYHGKYTYGFTIDGKLNASVIQTGILSTVLIQNADGSVRLDLGKRGGLDFYANGHKSITIQRQSIDLYDWEGTSRVEEVGSLFTSRRIINGSDSQLAGINLSHNENSYLALSYKNPATGKFRSYVDFDFYNVIPKAAKSFRSDIRETRGGSGNKAIKFHESIEVNQYSDFNARPSMKYGVWVGENDETYISYNGTTGRVQLVSPWGIGAFMTAKGTTQQIMRVQENSARFWDSNDNSYAVFSNTGFDLNDMMFSNKAGGITSRVDFHVMGNLTVAGNYPRNARGVEEEQNFDLLHEMYKKDLEIDELKSEIEELKNDIAAIKEMLKK